jgi:hypothetical protein
LKKTIALIIFLNISCHSQDLKLLADLPPVLKEASGAQTTMGSDLIWMLNDAGNPPVLYGLDLKGDIVKSLRMNDENHDWEDLATDGQGNLYIGDFGNNNNKRTDLVILKIKKEDLESTVPIETEKISFHYPDQKKFPPKNKKKYFDCEAFFFYQDSLYLFTKSRVEGKYGKTNMYKIPAKPGCHEALKIASYDASCDNFTCWTTSADISPDKSKIALLTPEALLIFSDFNGDDFFNGDVTEYKFEYITQKESVCFKDSDTVYITDEYSFGIGGNLYELKLD